jgi:hypothetical protein
MVGGWLVRGFYYPIYSGIYGNITIWLFNIAIGQWPIEIDDFPIETSIYKGFSMAILVITRW